METLKNYVNWKLAHSDKTATAEGYPLVMENCKTNKRMKQLEVYGDCLQSQTPSPDNPSEIQSVGDLITDTESEYYGKYKIPVAVRGKNLLPYPYHHTTHTRYGITFTDNGDGSITLNGTTTLAETGVYDFILVHAQKFKTGTYTLSGCPKTGATYTYRLFVIIRHSDGTVGYANDIGNNSTFKITDTDLVTINIRVGGQIGTVSNLTFKPQLELDSTATEYEPYIEPITQNIYLDEPLRKVGDYADYIDFKNQKVVRKVKEEDISCQLPKTLAKTTIIEVGTSLEPSNIKGKYIIK